MRLNSEVSSQGLRQLRASIDVSELARLNYDIIARDVRVEEFWNKFAKHYSAASEPEFWPPPPLNRASQREDRGRPGERAPRSAVRLSYPFLVTIYRPTWDQFPPLTTDLIPELERPYSSQSFLSCDSRLCMSPESRARQLRSIWHAQFERQQVRSLGEHNHENSLAE